MPMEKHSQQHKHQMIWNRYIEMLGNALETCPEAVERLHTTLDNLENCFQIHYVLEQHPQHKYMPLSSVKEGYR